MTTRSVNYWRIFWLSALVTVVLGLLVFLHGGWLALWLFNILVILEITLSFDNAVINSRVLIRMSPWWQKIFLTVGIFVAVFVVRFLLPIIIVMITANLDFNTVTHLALDEPV
ncbi:hypothetical protein CR956_01630, partial [Candidatus Saccharibacteria bacterium]